MTHESSLVTQVRATFVARDMLQTIQSPVDLDLITVLLQVPCRARLMTRKKSGN